MARPPAVALAVAIDQLAAALERWEGEEPGPTPVGLELAAQLLETKRALYHANSGAWHDAERELVGVVRGVSTLANAFNRRRPTTRLDRELVRAMVSRLVEARKAVRAGILAIRTR